MWFWKPGEFREASISLGRIIVSGSPGGQWRDTGSLTEEHRVAKLGFCSELPYTGSYFFYWLTHSLSQKHPSGNRDVPSLDQNTLHLLTRRYICYFTYQQYFRTWNSLPPSPLHSSLQLKTGFSNHCKEQTVWTSASKTQHTDQQVHKNTFPYCCIISEVLIPQLQSSSKFYFSGLYQMWKHARTIKYIEWIIIQPCHLPEP